MKITDKLDQIYNQYKEDFRENQVGSFHNLLWQIMVNESMKKKVVTFYSIVTPEGYEMVIAHAKGGYNPTGVLFNSHDYEYCSALTEEIARKVFDIDERLHDFVMKHSMGTAV